MKKLLLLKKTATLAASILFLFLFNGGLLAQLNTSNSIANNTSILAPTGPEDQEHTEKLASKWLEGVAEVKQLVNASDANFTLFTNFYQSYLDSEKCALYKLIRSGEITDANVTTYMDTKKQKLQAMYSNFLQIKNEYGSSVENNQGTHNLAPNAIACNPACTNIDFSAGNFTGWNGYYGVNSSSTTKFDITSITGGPLGSVAKGAHDPNTNTNQVHITSKQHNDWFLSNYHGITMSQASPFGTSNYAAMIGDSTVNEYGVGILSQQFAVTATNDNLTYDYAILLENPNHTYYQQPVFSIAVLDQNGDTIPHCGDYNVVSGNKLPGFKGEYNPVEGDTVYWKNWTRVNVPLTRYIGQCVTIIFQVSDCGLGAHFGYAYVDATCSHLQITASPIICGASEVISAPAGEARYKWIGPASGSILSPDTIQNITVSAPGTYSVVLTPFTGALCNDTLTTTLTQDNLSLSTSSTNILCYGNNTGSILATAGNGTAPYTYSWSPAVGTDSIATGLSTGAYTVTVMDANGCSVQSSVITITQPALLTASSSATAISCNGGNSTITVTETGGTAPYSGDGTFTVTAGTYNYTVTDANGCTSNTSITITQPALLTASSSATAISCNGGNSTITVTETGGTAPYSGDGTFTVTAGTYNYTVTDANGCTSNTSITITQPALLTASSSATAISCNGGNSTITVTETGGTAPYSGDGTFTVTAGTYNYTVTDANGCTSNTSITITQPNTLTASSSATAISCNGGNSTLTVSVTGGTAPYSGIGTFTVTAGTYNYTVTDANGCTANTSIIITQPVLLTASGSTLTNVLCNGSNNGSGSVSVTGGTSPYQYKWSTGATTTSINGLTAGSYSVNVTDANGCNAITSITISQPTLLTASASVQANVSCYGSNNGNGSISASGGTVPYQYIWSTGATTASISGLTAGSYSVTITDAHGCNVITSITISQPTLLTASASVQANVSCYGSNNGSGSISASGGTVPYQYTWSTGATTASISGLTVGSYSVTITDAHGCNVITSITISQPVLLTASALVKTNVSCYGSNNGSGSVSATGGIPAYTYKWSNGATTSSISSLTAGTYTATVTDAHGCISIATITITQPSILTLTTAQTNVSCNGGDNGSAKITATGGTAPYAYKWSTGVTTSSISSLTIGTYTATVTDAHGCTSIATVTIIQPAPIALSTSAVNASYCGYTNGSVTVSATGGTLPYTYKWSSNAGSKTTATVTGLTSGIYTVSVTDKNGCNATASVTVYTEYFNGLFAESSACSDIDINGVNHDESIATIVFVSGFNCPNTYSWAPSGGTNATATNLPNGTYTCTVTNCEGCIYQFTVTIDCFQINLPTKTDPSGLDDNNTANIAIQPSLYPNPTHGAFNIEGLSQGMRVEMYSYQGKLLSAYTVGAETTKQFDISDQANGIYLIRIINKDGTLVNQMKVIKTQ